MCHEPFIIFLIVLTVIFVFNYKIIENKYEGFKFICLIPVIGEIIDIIILWMSIFFTLLILTFMQHLNISMYFNESHICHEPFSIFLILLSVVFVTINLTIGNLLEWFGLINLIPIIGEIKDIVFIWISILSASVILASSQFLFHGGINFYHKIENKYNNSSILNQKEQKDTNKKISKEKSKPIFIQKLSKFKHKILKSENNNIVVLI